MKLAMAFGFACVLALAGCATPPPPPTYVHPFNPDEVAFIHNEGTNTIKGSGFLRQRNGGVVKCSGEPVWLIPEGAYSRERIGSMAPYVSAVMVKSDPPLMWQHVRKQSCDVDGRFRFDNVPRGSFYVVSSVFWEVSSPGAFFGPKLRTHGGTMIRRVSFDSDDETKEVTLSQME